MSKLLMIAWALTILISQLRAQTPTGIECGPLPDECKLQKITTITTSSITKKVTEKKEHGIRCDLNGKYDHNVNISGILNEHSHHICDFNDQIDQMTMLIIELRASILEENIANLIESFSVATSKQAYLNLVGVTKGFDFDLIENRNISFKESICFACNLDFYINQTYLIKSCDDILHTNKSFSSIFQMSENDLTLVNSEFKTSLCPLAFNDSTSDLYIIGMIDSFYKKSVLTFTSDKFVRFISKIDTFNIYEAHNIDLDSKLLHPLVFRNITELAVFGSVKHISDEALSPFVNLKSISFELINFRKMIHNSGIKWSQRIKQNSDFNFFINHESNALKSSNITFILLDCSYLKGVKVSNVFPDEDFCLYLDFPFNQFVLLIPSINEQTIKMLQLEYSCTFLLLSQHYDVYLKLLENYSIVGHERTLSYIIESNEYKILHSKCNLTSMKSLCDKESFSIKGFWGIDDYLGLNKRLNEGIKISTYIVSFIGVITNLLIVVMILHKNNSDLLKENNKRYNYLCANAIFSLLILIIQLLSWMSECFYPYEVFCPDIHKLVGIQLFKMIFKECLVATFRFMCSFTYLAFIIKGIPKQEKSKEVGGTKEKTTTKSPTCIKMHFKTYLGVTLFISSLLSIVKYFKYAINFDQPEANYPMSQELYIDVVTSSKIASVQLIMNAVSDILNYIVFVVAIFIFEVILTVRLRQELNNLEAKQSPENDVPEKKEETEREKKCATRRLVINTVISIICKVPISLISLVNLHVKVFAYGVFQYDESEDDEYHKHYNPAFPSFYSFLLNSELYESILSCFELFYTIAISIQFFIYIGIDLKMRTMLSQLFSKKSNNHENNQ